MTRNRPQTEQIEASDFILPISEMKQNEKSVGLPRVSKRDQYRDENLKGQLANIPHEIRKAGGIPVKLRKPDDWYVASDSGFKWEMKIDEVINECRKRSYSTEQDRKHLQPTSEQLSKFRKKFEGVRIYSVMDLDASNEEQTAFLRKWNDRAKGKTDESPQSLLILKDEGASIREISAITGRSVSTVKRWLKVA